MTLAVIAVAKVPWCPGRHFVQFKDVETIPQEFLNFLQACGEEDIWDESAVCPNTNYIESIDWRKSEEFLNILGFETRLVNFENNADTWWPIKLRNNMKDAVADFDYILSLEDYDERTDS